MFTIDFFQLLDQHNEHEFIRHNYYDLDIITFCIVSCVNAERVELFNNNWNCVILLR